MLRRSLLVLFMSRLFRRILIMAGAWLIFFNKIWDDVILWNHSLWAAPVLKLGPALVNSC